MQGDLPEKRNSFRSFLTSRMSQRQIRNQLRQIKPGMLVEASEGYLGDDDLSKPKVTKIVRNSRGQIEKVVAKKGVIFSKEIEIPVDRIQAVDLRPQGEIPGRVVIDATDPEIAALGSIGTSELPKEEDLLDDIQEAMPTTDGQRDREQHNVTDTLPNREQVTTTNRGAKPKTNLLKLLGPGFLGGMAGNDPTAVTAYTVDGAQSGYGHLWLMLLATPLWQAVLFACAKIGRVTQKGFADILREHYGLKVAGPAALALIIGNVALIAGDLGAIGSGLSLMTGINWIWFVIPVAIVLWYVTVYQSFDVIKKIFLVMSLAFITYIIAGLLSGANWGAVLKNTFVPDISFDFAGISSAMAILGATMSPYTMFWQVQGEKEEEREGPTKKQFRLAALDIGSGVLSGNLVSYFIILCTSATLFTHHKTITTAADAANALAPLVGPFAKYLFAVGLIGAGLIAIPVLLASTSYALSEIFKLPASLSNKPWQNEGFYLILTIALVSSLIVAMLGLNPISLMFWANVLQTFLAPILIALIFIIGNNRKIMKRYRLGLPTNIGLVVVGFILVASAAIWVVGLLTGQGGS